MKTESQRTCPSCGSELSGAMELCPVCMLRKALADRVESGESSFEEAVKPTPEQAARRFEHYELVVGEHGKPIELGRGAMRVTYKAFDVDLHCPMVDVGNADLLKHSFLSRTCNVSHLPCAALTRPIPSH
jgi:hypothetical protein